MAKTLILLFVACTLRSYSQEKNNFIANDIRLFQGTSAWNLAKAVRDEDTLRIKEIVQKDKIPVDFQEPKFGITLLTWTAITHHYNSIKTLLQLGANPNLPDKYDGSNSMIEEIIWNCHDDDDTRFLELLLKFGANPNYIEQGKRREGNWTRNTPLFEAASCSFAKTKLLIAAGANINFKNKFNQTALLEAIGGGKDAAKITRYLLIDKKANFRNTYVVTMRGNKTSFAGLLRNWRFDLNSQDYKIKMEIVKYLKTKGQDYWKTSIPKRYYDNYSKEYLDKY